MIKLLLSLSGFTLLTYASANAQDNSLKSGQSALMSHNYKQAETDFTTYVGTFQGRIDGYLTILRAYDTSSQYQRSTTFSSFKINHEWAEGYYGRAMARLNLSQNDDASKDLDMAIKIDPTYADVYYQQSLLKKASGDKLGACICTGKALANNDTMKAARSNYSSDFCWMTGLEYFKKGRDHVDINEFADGIKDLNMAVTICPDSANFYAYRGMAFNGLGKSDSAISDFANALRLDPNNYYAYYYRALAYEQKQKYNDAFNDLSQAIKLRPNSVDAYSHRAEDCENSDKEASAIFDYQQVIRLKPSEGMPYYKVALYRLKLSQNTGACEYFNKALELGVDDAQSYVDDCKKAAAKILTK